MTSSTQISEIADLPGNLTLLACGLDAEQQERFAPLQGEALPWPLVFSAEEARHNNALPDPAAGYCAAYCCKEAAYKALGPTCSLLDCQLRYKPGEAAQTIQISPDVMEQLGIADIRARVLLAPDEEVVAVLQFFGDA